MAELPSAKFTSTSSSASGLVDTMCSNRPREERLCMGMGKEADTTAPQKNESHFVPGVLEDLFLPGRFL